MDEGAFKSLNGQRMQPTCILIGLKLSKQLLQGKLSFMAIL